MPVVTRVVIISLMIHILLSVHNCRIVYFWSTATHMKLCSVLAHLPPPAYKHMKHTFMYINIDRKKVGIFQRFLFNGFCTSSKHLDLLLYIDYYQTRNHSFYEFKILFNQKGRTIFVSVTGRKKAKSYLMCHAMGRPSCRPPRAQLETLTENDQC